jgi:hypothetical protein
MAHAYNKGYEIKLARNVMQRATSNATRQATVNIPRLANVRAWNDMQSLRPLKPIPHHASEISGSHGGEYEDDSLLGHCAV